MYRNVVLQDISKADLSQPVQLIRTGTFAYFGEDLKITKDTLRQFKENFENKVRGIELAVDFFHDSGATAAGWIETIELRNDDTELWIGVNWTPKATQMLSDKELRYLSADFQFNYKDNETGKKFGATLFGAGLTNRPHIKNMQAILSECNDKQKTELRELLDKDAVKLADSFEDIKRIILDMDLTDDEKGQLVQMLGGHLDIEVDGDIDGQLSENENEHEKDTQMSEQNEEVEALEVTLSEKDTKIAELEAKVQLSEKTAAFAKLLAEGHVVPAQEQAYLAGDMAKFAEGAKEVNLKARGTGEDPEGEEVTTSENVEDKVIDLATARAEADKIELTEAIDLVLSDDPKLNALYEKGAQ